jgi:sugar lactone lactonase YvrE
VRIDAAGQKERFFDDTLLEEPVELALRGDELFVLGNDTQNALRVDAAGRLLAEIHPLAKDAHDFAFDDAGHLFVGSAAPANGGGSIQVWDVDDEELIAHFGTKDEVESAMGLAFAPDGTLVVADYGRSRVARFDPTSGVLLEVLVGMSRPVAVEVDPTGGLWVLEDAGVCRYDGQSGALLEVVVPRGDKLVAPRSLLLVPAR